MMGASKKKGRENLLLPFTEITETNEDQSSDESLDIDPYEDNKILLADDDIFVHFAIKNLVEQKFNKQIDQAMEGMEALEKIKERLRQQKPYNVIILDLNMPGLNGLELAREIRREEKKYRVAQTIICSSSVGDETLDDLNSKAVDFFIPKPLTFQSLKLPFERSHLI